MKNLTPCFSLSGVFFGIAMFVRVFAQDSYNLDSCLMCSIQTILLTILFVISVVGMNDFVSQEKTFFKLLQGCIVLEAALALIHFSIQMSVLPDFCHLVQLRQPKCSDITWSIFGVSASLVNFLFQTFVFLVIKIQEKYGDEVSY